MVASLGLMLGPILFLFFWGRLFYIFYLFLLCLGRSCIIMVSVYFLFFLSEYFTRLHFQSVSPSTLLKVMCLCVLVLLFMFFILLQFALLMRYFGRLWACGGVLSMLSLWTVVISSLARRRRRRRGNEGKK